MKRTGVTLTLMLLAVLGCAQAVAAESE
ncbi:uncharacterized protein METZ01_LOCUS408706 [marine metagenome]|uniref:Uncharacterized protein n=1 Tax=marine metagenome TaxID=408172 RepID=A0A382WAM7_9ZZZZ